MFDSRTRPCLQYQIKRCSAPCVGKITPEAYGETVRDAERFLSGKSTDIQARLAAQITGFVQKLREEPLEKVPGIAETLDFAAALMGLGVADLTHDPAALQATMATLLKTQADRAAVPTEVAQRLAGRAA